VLRVLEKNLVGVRVVWCQGVVVIKVSFAQWHLASRCVYVSAVQCFCGCHQVALLLLLLLHKCSSSLERIVQCEGAAVVCMRAAAVAWCWVSHEACQVQLVQHSVLLCTQMFVEVSLSGK
jgi:hypothetical protein